MDWIEQCFMSLPTRYRLYGRRLQVKRPNQQHQRTEGTNSTQTNQTYSNQTWTQNTASPLVYNNMGWLGDGSHRGQGCQAWMAVGLLPRYPNTIINTIDKVAKGAFHQRRSNLGSAEPGSTLIVDLNQVQVMMRSTNVKLRSADVVQLNHDCYTSWTLIGPIWSRLVTSHVLFTLVLMRSKQRPQVANVFNLRSVFLCSHFVIIPPSHHHGREIWGWSDSTDTHSLLLKVNKIKITVITHSIAPAKLS